MAQTWATPEYEDRLLTCLLGRIERDLEIEQAKKKDPKKHKAIIKNEMVECYHDPVYFIENFLFTDKNPFFFSDKIGTKVPYILFDYQIETIDTLFKCVEK